MASKTADAAAEKIGPGPEDVKRLEEQSLAAAAAVAAEEARFRKVPPAVARFFRGEDGAVQLEVRWTGRKDRISRPARAEDFQKWPEAAEAFRAADRKPIGERERG